MLGAILAKPKAGVIKVEPRVNWPRFGDHEGEDPESSLNSLETLSVWPMTAKACQKKNS